MNKSQLHSYFYQYIKPLLVRSINKGGYLFFFQSSHSILFKRLHHCRFFEFYSTNNGCIVSEHQIVAFFFCGGYQALLNGFTCPQGEMEIHHINANTVDNRPANLVYLSTSDHQAVSHFSHTSFLSQVKTALSTPFNKQGKPVKDHFHYLSNVLAATLSAAHLQCDFIIPETLTLVIQFAQDWYQKQSQKVTRFFQRHFKQQTNFIFV